MLTAKAVTSALNGKWYERGGGNAYGLAKCPAHDDRNPSLRICDGETALLVNCLAGCDARDVLAALRQRALLEEVQPRDRSRHARQRSASEICPTPLQSRRPAEGAPARGSAEPEPEPVGNPNLETAHRIWKTECVSLDSPQGALARHYFEQVRGIDLQKVGGLDHALRWHESRRMIVALMRDPRTSVARGIHRTFLDANGAKIERKMLGPAGIVALSPFSDVTMGLALSEGIEDGLHVLASGFAPLWAAPSAGLIKSFPVLLGIEALTLFTDHDEAGMGAAETCAQRWLDADRDVNVLPAGTPHD